MNLAGMIVAAPGWIRRNIPVITVVATYLWSAVAIVTYRSREAPPGTITLRIGHWQLEASVREALNAMAEDYARTHPRVKIIQDAIPESIYGQWVSTQLMGNTAPDMLELGLGLPYHVWVSYYNRYFIPLTRHVNRPNPYNRGTELEGVPLRQTFKDAMRSSYVQEMQEYISIPLSQFGVRIFYNRDLLKKLTGRDEAPQEYRAFLRVCEEIERHRDPKGRPYIAIAGSKYHLPMWESMMFDPLTYALHRKCDFNRDGFVGNDELYVAFKIGLVDFNHPALRARFRMMREVTSHFQVGYTGLTRDEAVFLFAQQRAVFISTGTWDARSLQKQAEGRFRVGVMDFPLPRKDDPEFGDVIEGPIYEQPMGGFPFGITRTCRHPDVALDFLLFLAGQKQNEKLNRIIGWIPSVRGARVDPLLKAFEPHLVGVYSCMNFFLGGDTWIKWQQLYSAFQVGEISYEELAREFTPFYKEQGIKDFMEQQRDWRRGMHVNENFLAGIRARAMSARGEEAVSRWIKYRVLTTERQVWPEISHARQMKLLLEGPRQGRLGPYEYTPQVLRAVEERIRRELEEAGGGATQKGEPG